MTPSEKIYIESAEREAIELFSFLVSDRGFRGPVVRRDAVSITLDYLRDALGIELKFDWRDVDVSVVLVRLDEGQLPNGYFVSNGRRCRAYLVNWLTQIGRYDGRGQRRRHPRHASKQTPMESIRAELESSYELVRANIELIESEGLTAFEAAPREP